MITNFPRSPQGKPSWPHRALATVALVTFAAAALATRFNLVPVNMGSGWTMFGTIETNGRTGHLDPADLSSWQITVQSDTDYVYDRTNTANLSSEVYATDGRLLLPTSPDGQLDGGALMFYGGVYNQARVADFTGAFSQGGAALFAKGSAFETVQLGQANGILYEAGRETAPNSTVFSLNPVQFPSAIVMSGTVVTDGTAGLVHLLDWNVRVRETWKFVFTPANSRVLSATGLAADGTILTVTPQDPFGNGNELAIGFGTLDLTAALLADFSYLPGGQAGYLSPFGIYTLSPLSLNPNGDYVVATAAGIERLSPIYENVTLGTLNSGGSLGSWASQDGDVRTICKFIVPSRASPIVRVDLGFNSTKRSLTSIEFMTIAKALHPGLFTIRQEMKDWSSGQFVTVLTDSVLDTSYRTYTGVPTGNLGSLLNDTGGAVARIEVRQVGPGAVAQPCASFDQAELRVSD